MLIRSPYVAITLLLVFATISFSVARADDDERKPAVSDAYLYPDANLVIRSYDPGTKAEQCDARERPTTSDANGKSITTAS